MRNLRVILLGAFIIAGCAQLFAAGEDANDLRAQLAVAEEKQDKPAVAEISRRILETEPQDQAVWEKRVRALLETGDLEHCGQTLDEWEKQAKPANPAATDLRGDLAFAREDYEAALKFWNASLPGQPRREKTYEKIAWVYELQNNWAKADETLTNLIEWRQAKHLFTRMFVFQDSAGTHIWRARCRMEMRKWDDAYADIKKANKLDASDAAVKQWLPQFETLAKSLPQIKALDEKIDAAPKWPLLLDRALLFYDAERFDLALEDAEQAQRVGGAGARSVLLIKGGALIALDRPDEAAKLKIVVKKGDIPDDTLQKIRALDAQILDKGPSAALLADRARLCNDLEQYALALDDAEAACSLDLRSADAFVEHGFALMKLGRADTARKNFETATELAPKNFIAWRSLGEIEMDRANYPAAIGFFSRSLKLHESPKVLEKRAACYRNSGHNKEADADLQRFQKLTATKKK